MHEDDFVTLSPSTNLSFVHIPRSAGTFTKNIFTKLNRLVTGRVQRNFSWSRPIVEIVGKHQEDNVYQHCTISLSIMGTDVTLSNRGKSEPGAIYPLSHSPADPRLIDFMGFNDSFSGHYRSCFEEEITSGLRATDNIIRFGIVRNPYDMLARVYPTLSNVRAGGFMGDFSDFCHSFVRNDGKLYTDSFNDKAKDYLVQDSIYKPFGTPADRFLYWWLFDHEGNSLVDFVIQFDNIEIAIRQLLDLVILIEGKDCDSIKEKLIDHLIENTNTNTRTHSGVWDIEEQTMTRERSATRIPSRDFTDVEKRIYADILGDVFERECNLMGYTIDGPIDNNIFMKISGVSYDFKNDVLSIKYPPKPCSLKLSDI